ncbi:MAG TPA: hypothetical protein VJK54_02140 [Chthoniobacterales bacterium]|nr:hypothetical protein [Chthoniobacterales bacterium]
MSIPKFHTRSVYPVTVAQYCTFLNAVAAVSDTHHLYDERMASDPTIASIDRTGNPGHYFYSVIDGREDFPITYVNLFSSLRFCNWLEHEHPLSTIAGKEDSITEIGTYALESDTKISNPSPHATWYLPREDDFCYREGCDPWTKSNQIGFRVAANQSIFPPSLIINGCTQTFYEKVFANAPLEDSFMIFLITLIAAAVAGGVILTLGRFIKVIGPWMGAMLAARSAADREMLKAQGEKVPDSLLAQGIRLLLSTLLALGIGWLLLSIGLAAGPVTLSSWAAADIVEIAAAARIAAANIAASEVAIANAVVTAVVTAVATAVVNECDPLSLFVRSTTIAIKEAPLQTLFAALLGSGLGTDISINLHSPIGRIVEACKEYISSKF